MFGKNLKKWRELRDMTQSELAARINVSDKTISSWEVGRTEPSMGMVEMIADVLRCSKSELIGDVAILTYTEKRIIDQFRALDPVQQQMIVASIDAAYAAIKKDAADILSA